MAGDKQAQFELGRRYEAGNGVPRDIDRAKRLYRAAASASDGTNYVYAPSPVPGGAAQVLPVEGGTPQPGLAAARERLDILELGEAPPSPPASNDAQDEPDGPEQLARIYLHLIALDARFAACGGQKLRNASSSEFRLTHRCIAQPFTLDCAADAESVAEVRSLIEAATVLRVLRWHVPREVRRCASGPRPSHTELAAITRSPISYVNWYYEAGHAEGRRPEIPGPSVQLSAANKYLSYVCGLDRPSLAELYLCTSLRPSLLAPNPKSKEQ